VIDLDEQTGTEPAQPRGRARIAASLLLAGALIVAVTAIVTSALWAGASRSAQAKPTTSTVVITTPKAFSWVEVSVNGQPAQHGGIGGDTLTVADLRSVAVVVVVAEGVQGDPSCAIAVDGVVVARAEATGAGVPVLCAWTR
jgi:hypothetical protein